MDELELFYDKDTTECSNQLSYAIINNNCLMFTIGWADYEESMSTEYEVTIKDRIIVKIDHEANTVYGDAKDQRTDEYDKIEEFINYLYKEFPTL